MKKMYMKKLCKKIIQNGFIREFKNVDFIF